MKVCLIQSHLIRSGFWGGVLLTRQIAAGLANAGHDVHVTELTHEPTSPTTQLGPAIVHHLRASPMQKGVNPLWAWYPEELDVIAGMDFLSRLSPDVIYGHMLPENMPLYEAAIRLGLPIVQHVHDFSVLCGRSFLVDDKGRACAGPAEGRCESCLRTSHAPALRLGMRLASLPGGEAVIRGLLGPRRTERFRLRAGVDRFFAFRRRLMEAVHSWIATGPRIRDVLCRHGVEAGRVTILPHALPDDRRVLSPPPPPLAGRPVRIGYFGRIAPEKGVDMLANAIRRLQRTVPRDFEWWVISGVISPKDRARLQERASLPQDRIRFIEGTQGAALNPVLAQLDVCVVPSLCPEIGPLTLLEALAQGVPCICNDMAGLAHLVREGSNGFLFRTGDQDDLLRTLARCMADDEVLPSLRSHACPIAPFADFIRQIEATLAAALSPASQARG